MKPFVCTFAFFALLASAAAQTPGVPSIPPDYQDRAPAGMSQADAQAQAAAEADQEAANQQASNAEQPAPAPVPYPPAQANQPQYPQQPSVPPDAYPDDQDESQDQPPYAGQQQPAPDQQQYPQQSPYPAQQPYPDQPPVPQAPPVYYPEPHARTAPQRPAQHSIQPRTEAYAYPVYREQPQFSVGARLLSAEETEGRISTPLSKHYLVVEVGFYPAASQTVDLRNENFTLRANKEDQAFFPATPDEILTDLGNHRSGPRVYPSVGVGYGHGPWGSSVATGVGVGVAPGGPPQRRTSVNQEVMLMELREKALPEGNLTQPVAGYLYFPLGGKRAKQYTLELRRDGETIALPLPTPKN